jgi:ornithine cyclodeaminase/alanine dehydrogenase-like protein (mu-crystallin family)
MGSVPSRDIFALRIDSDHCIFRENNTEYQADPYTGLVLLFNITDTRPIAILDDHALSPLRVGATAAVGAKYLASANADTMGLFGSGEQAEQKILAIQDVCDFDEIKVYSPTRGHRKAFAEKFDARLEAEVHAVDAPKELVIGSDVVVAATNSNEPVFDGEWLESGTCVITVVGGEAYENRTEIDTTTVRRADRIVANRVEQIQYDKQGNLYDLLQSGEISEEDIAELSQVVTGEKSGRETDEEITLFKNNCGLGHQFAVAGSLMLECAKNENVGFEIPQTWFTTDRDGEAWSP